MCQNWTSALDTRPKFGTFIQKSGQVRSIRFKFQTQNTPLIWPLKSARMKRTCPNLEQTILEGLAQKTTKKRRIILWARGSIPFCCQRGSDCCQRGCIQQWRLTIFTVVMNARRSWNNFLSQKITASTDACNRNKLIANPKPPQKSGSVKR